MIYTEQQLGRFANPPFKYEQQQVITTHEAIREAINDYLDRDAIKERYDMSGYDLEIFLQGSYRNNTNISKSSDVDIVVKLNSVYIPGLQGLSTGEQRQYDADRNPSNYRYKYFRSHVMSALQEYFGEQNITLGHKSIKLRQHGDYCDADIIPAFTHRQYNSYSSGRKNDYIQGIAFYTTDDIEVINFPKRHREALAQKSDATDGNFKETVRMFKNLKEQLVENGRLNDGIAKSYFIENLLYNMPDMLFSGTYTERFNWLLNNMVNSYQTGATAEFYCANGITRLVSPATWNTDSIRQFLNGLCYIRDYAQF